MELKLDHIAAEIKPVSAEWHERARNYLNNLTAPQGSLGELLALAEQQAAVKETLSPSVKKKVVVTMAGDHGVVEEGVSAYPQEVTPQMVENFVAGGAAINILAEVANAEVIVADIGVASDLSELVQKGEIVSYKVGWGTDNIARGPAMSREQAVQCLEAGIQIAAGLHRKGVEFIGTGDMGIGNTTSSSAVLAGFTGLPLHKITGKGTGINDHALELKMEVIGKALKVNRPDPRDPLDILSKVGGFEIGGIAGLILGASYFKIPVIIDGFISSAGALLAKKLVPAAVDYMIAAHRSQEYGHGLMLDALGLTPLLNLNLRLGEGTGAALAMPVVESAVSIMNNMATFEDAGVSREL